MLDEVASALITVTVTETIPYMPTALSSRRGRLSFGLCSFSKRTLMPLQHSTAFGLDV